MTDRDRPSSPPTLAGPTTLSSTTSTIPYSRLMSDNEGTGDQAEVEVETTTTTAVEKENEEKEEDPAETIKAVHASLRRRCQRLEREEEGGVEDFQEEVEDVWRSHLGEEEELQKYASAMHRLATGKWTRRRRKKKTKKRKKAGEEEVVVFDDDDLVDVPDRISWIVSHIDKYFRRGDASRLLRRAAARADVPLCEAAPVLSNLSAGRVRVLDVGSCFNPLGDYDDLDVTAVDIAPAVQGVQKCDFLTVKVGSTSWNCWSHWGGRVTVLPPESFDAVVFSLLLEYLPVPELRYRACKQAWRVLKHGGLLLVVTPDSSHQGKNQDQMRRWRAALASVGFGRAYYEKLDHLHCMAFSKLDGCPGLRHFCVGRHSEELGAPVGDRKELARLMGIPQDRTTREELQREEEEVRRRETCDVAAVDEKEVADMMAELPGFG